MKRGRQGQPSKPQSAPQPPAALKSDSRRLGKEGTGSDPIPEDFIDGVQSLSLSAFDRATAAVPFRPFDLLPNELVAVIFAESVSSNIQPRKRHEAPCRLLRISKRCHEIAAGTPHLWTTIVVWGYLKGSRLRPYLRRSQNFAVDVYAYGRFEKEAPSLVDQLREITFSFDRWRSLNMRTNNHRMVSTLLSQLPANLDLLETLRIKSNRPATAGIFMLYPKLETLVLKGLHLDWRKLNITSLQHLEVELRQLNDAVWASFVAFLNSNAKQLRHLSIRFGEKVLGRPTGEELQLALLDTLRITDTTGDIAGTLLHLLEAPCLKSLELSGNGMEGASWYLEDGLKSVEELRLHDFTCSEDVVVSLLKQVPSLRRVSMRTEGVRPNQVHSLMELSSSRQIAWRIRLTAEDCSIDEETTDGDFEAAQQELAWLATNSDFSIKDFQLGNVIHFKRLPIMQWNLVDDPEWGKKVWLPPVRCFKDENK